jgi:hypothetical protein
MEAPLPSKAYWKVIRSARFCSIDGLDIIGVLRKPWIIVFQQKHVGISRRRNIMDVSMKKIINRDLMEINLGLEGVFTRLTELTYWLVTEPPVALV